MKWAKKGFICSHETLDLPWYKKNTMVPVPHMVSEDVLRIFVTMCDADNIGRIGYIDVNPKNPSELLAVSQTPVLDIGNDGTFDDSGVLPSALFQQHGKTYMLYSAYQKHTKVPYAILTGLAVFDETFERLTRVNDIPFLERTSAEMFIRSAAYCVEEDTQIRCYYSSGDSWTHNTIKEVPRYDIKCLQADTLSGLNHATPISCLTLQADEYGLTTPNVWKENNIYKMTYSIRSVSKGYRIGYAESADGLVWQRMDARMELDVTPHAWDSEMICFGNLVSCCGKTYLFYCGNHYGMAGMGYAELVA